MSLKVLNVVRFPIGGIRSYLRYTYSRLDPASYSATIVTVDRPEAQLIPEGMKPLSAELTTVGEKHALLGLSAATNRLARSGRFGLVHSQGTTAAVIGAVACGLNGLPHVVTLHETFRAEQFSGILGKIKRRILGRALSAVDGIVTVSTDARNNLLEHVPLDAKAAEGVEVIRNGVAVDMLLRDIPGTRLNLRSTKGIPDDVVLLGYVGRFMPEKGFDLVLDAARLLNKIPDLPRYVIAAVNDGAFVREYQQQVADWGLGDSFIFVGFQSSAAGTITELDAVVMPSRREACPLVPMEAMVLGCPLIASDCIGLREVTAGTPSLTFTTGDAASLARQLERFIRNRDSIRQGARDYMPTARKVFDSGVAAERLLGVFNRALSAHQPGRAVPA